MRADPNGTLAIVLQSLADVGLPIALGIALVVIAAHIGRKFK